MALSNGGEKRDYVEVAAISCMQKWEKRSFKTMNNVKSYERKCGIIFSNGKRERNGYLASVYSDVDCCSGRAAVSLGLSGESHGGHLPNVAQRFASSVLPTLV